MKKLLLTTVLAVATIVAMANPIGRSAAMQKAQDFMRGINPQAQLQAGASPRKAMGTNGSPAYYIFNAEGNQGYVIISGDDRSEEILGYADKGFIDVNNMPEALQGFLDGFALDLKQLDEAGITAPLTNTNAKAPRKAVAVARTTITPLTTVLWTQSSPFNDSIPTMDDGKQPPVGCGNNAAAELVYHWKHATPVKPIPAYTTTSGSRSVYCPELPIYDFNAQIGINLLDDYTGVSNTTANRTKRQTIAKFIKYVCQATRATFRSSLDGGSSIVDFWGCMKLFGLTYSRQMSKSSCQPQEFEEYIYRDLAQGLPVWYLGQSGVNAHQFLIDGYSSDDFFHINWGWAGSCNGYFRLSPLNAYNSSTTWNWATRGAWVALGVRPPGHPYNIDDEISDAQASLKTISFSDNETDLLYDDIEIEKGQNGKFTSSTLKLRTRLENWTNATDYSSRNFDAEIAIYNSDMQKVATLGEPQTVSIAQGNGQVLYYNLRDISLEDGVYYFVPRSKDSEYDGDYHIDVLRGVYAYAKAVVEGNTMKMSLVEQMTIDNYEIVGQKKDPYRTAILFTVTNHSFETMTRHYSLYKDDTKSGKLVAAQIQDNENFRIPPLSTEVVCMEFDSGTANTELYLVNIERSSVIDCRIPFTPGAEGVTSYKSKLTFTPQIENSGSKQSIYINSRNRYYDAYPLYADKIVGNLIVKNNSNTDIEDVLTLAVQYGRTPYNNRYKSANQVFPVKIPAGGTVSLDLSSLNYSGGLYSGDHIWFILYDGRLKGHDDGYGESECRLFDQLYVVPTASVKWWDKDGKVTASNWSANSNYTVPANAVAVSFKNLTVSNYVIVNNNTNPNCLFYFDDSSEAKKLVKKSGSYFSSYTQVTDRNIVTGTTAGNINFVEGYGAYVPYSFRANNVTYTRTFNTAYTGDVDYQSWSTICLPFTPTSIKSGTTDLDWFHSNKDKGKAFWLEKFYSEDYTKVVFDYAVSMEANIPYLIRVSNNMKGKAITFSASNAEVVNNNVIIDADNYNFVGSHTVTQEERGKTVYGILSTDGNAFEKTATLANDPFRAYITAESDLQNIVPINTRILASSAVTHRFPAVKYTYGSLSYQLPAWDELVVDEASNYNARIQRMVDVEEGATEVPARIVGHRCFSSGINTSYGEKMFGSFNGANANSNTAITINGNACTVESVTYGDVFGDEMAEEDKDVKIFDISKPNRVNTYEVPGRIEINGLTYIVEEIGDGAFRNYDATTNNIFDAEKVVIPASVVSIGRSAFHNQKNLTSIEFEEGSVLKEIHKQAFENCCKLQEISLPESVTKLGAASFGGCTALRKINFASVVSPLLETAAIEPNYTGYTGPYSPFESDARLGKTNFNKENCVVYVPLRSVSTYRNSDELWNEFTFAAPVSATKKFVSFCNDAPFTTRQYDGSSWVSQSDIKMYWANVSKNNNPKALTLSPTKDNELEIIPAGFGVVMRTSSTGGSGYIFMPPVGASEKADLVAENNMLKGCIEQTPMDPIIEENPDNRYYGLTDNTFRRIELGRNNATAAGRAYLEMPASLFNNESKLAFTLDDGETDGIMIINDDAQEVNGGVYDIQGRKVESTSKGIYIVNGKKVVMK